MSFGNDIFNKRAAKTATTKSEKALLAEKRFVVDDGPSRGPSYSRLQVAELIGWTRVEDTLDYSVVQRQHRGSRHFDKARAAKMAAKRALIRKFTKRPEEDE